MANGDQYLSGGGTMPVRLAPNNPAAIPVFEDGSGAVPVQIVTFTQNSGAVPVRLSSAANGGAMPVVFISGGGAVFSLLLESGLPILMEGGGIFLLE